MQSQNRYGQIVGREIKEWSSRPHPEKVTLQGNYTIVCPLAPDHAEDLYREWQSIDDDRDWTYLTATKPATKEACYQYFRDLSAEPKTLHFSVKDKNNGVVKGIFCVTGLDYENGGFHIGDINWTPPMKRTRLSTEALFLMLEYFFDKLKFRRCEWRTNVNNLTSIASAERIGFKKEGVLREKRITKGHSEDIAVFSITVVDWMVISPAMKAWLRKENFDDRGRQVKKLSEFHG